VAFQRGKVARKVATLVDPPVVSRRATALRCGAPGQRESSSGHHAGTKTTKAALRREKALLKWVELRGLEPLTPTLPGRHDRVRGGSLPFRKPCEQRRNTAAHDYE
jgi:hypothetical protein